MHSLRATHARRRRLRAIALSLVPLVLAVCLNDRSAGPSSGARATLRLQNLTAGAPAPACVPPAITPTKARVVLRARGQLDSTVAVGNFAGATATMVVDVPLTDPSVLFDIVAQVIDATTDTVFRASDTVTVRAGDVSIVNYLQLSYSAPDAALAFLSIAPRDSNVPILSTFPMRFSGVTTSDATYTGTYRLGFISRDPTVADISTSGIVTAKSKPGTTTLVASTWLGICDSTTVVVLPPVAAVTLTPDTMDVERGNTVQLVAALTDATGKQLTGRTVTWSSSNANASVDANGLVTALVANKSARIFATSETIVGFSGIGILPKPVGSVKIAPNPGVVNIGQTLPLSATAYDSTGVIDTDYPIVWSALDLTIATVSPAGVVTGVFRGQGRIVATANLSADTVTLTVQ